MLTPLHSILFTPSTFLFFNDPATTDLSTLSLHDALPISRPRVPRNAKTTYGDRDVRSARGSGRHHASSRKDRKSTRLNSSHRCISYAVFCLKKQKKKDSRQRVYNKTCVTRKKGVL